jgi:DNA-binding MarR family transcriptional regulator
LRTSTQYSIIVFMDSRTPLPTLLSHALVAYIIELDNEFEHRMPHRTTDHGRSPGTPRGPWLTSVAMWSTCLRFVGEEGLRVRDRERLARTRTNLAGLQRWGYITLDRDPADPRPKPPEADLVIHTTAAGRRMREAWRALFGVIEERWRERFGTKEVDRLRDALTALTARFETDVPDCLPILGYGLFTRDGVSGVEPRRSGDGSRTEAQPEDATLYALLSRVLLAFALVFERKSKSDVALAIGSNVLRVLTDGGVRVRDLPQLSGVSKEAVAMAVGFLERQDMAVVEADPDGGRWKVVRLTEFGLHTRNAYFDRLEVVEERFRERLGAEAVDDVRAALEGIVGDPTARSSPLMAGLEPYPDGWRAAIRPPETLPHYPMMLHRGGYPDGS